MRFTGKCEPHFCVCIHTPNMPEQTNSTVFLRPRGLAFRQEGCACLRPSVREKLHPVKRAVDIDARRADARVTAVQNVRTVAREFIHAFTTSDALFWPEAMFSPARR